jgi:hypothetical protein
MLTESIARLKSSGEGKKAVGQRNQEVERFEGQQHSTTPSHVLEDEVELVVLPDHLRQNER